MVLQKPLAAAILAGGRARRMAGADKGALEVGGASILHRQLALLSEMASDLFVVVGWGGRAPAGLPAGIRVVADRIAGAGALGGIYTAIVESPCDRTLVVACDMPFVTRPLLERLAAEEADVVMPRTAQGYEPLCAIYTKACAEGIRKRIEHGDLRASVPPAGVRVIELGPEVLAALDPRGSALTNVNTPDDHEQARRLADRTGERARGKG